MYKRGLIDRIRRSAHTLFIQKIIFSSLILLSYLTLVGDTFTKNEAFVWLNGFFSFGVLILGFTFGFVYFGVNDVHFIFKDKKFKVLFGLFTGVYLIDFLYLLFSNTLSLLDYHEFIFYTIIMIVLLVISLILLAFVYFYKKNLKESSDDEILNRFLEKNMWVKNLNVVEKAMVQRQRFPSFFILLIYLLIGSFEDKIAISIPVLGVTMLYYIYKTVMAAKIEGKKKYFLYFSTLILTLLFIVLYTFSASGIIDFGVDYSDIQFVGLTIMLPFYIFRLINNKHVHLLNVYHFLAAEMISIEEQRLKQQGLSEEEIKEEIDKLFKEQEVDFKNFIEKEELDDENKYDDYSDYDED